MNNAIAVIEDSISQDFFNDSTWTQFFDIQQALKDFRAHIGGLPSDDTPEQYTRESYERGLAYFIEWAGGLFDMRFPNESLLTEYIDHLRHEKVWYQGQPPKDGSPDERTPHNGVSAGTVASSYLAPLRIFVKKLVKQATPDNIKIDFFDSGEDKSIKRDMRDLFIEWKEQMRSALDEVKNPKGDTTNVSALYNPKFNRLKKGQVRKVLRSFDRKTIVGARDYCIFRIPIECALRVAELQRITLSSFEKVKGGYTITVRGKRSNYDPVPITSECYDEIMKYVELYNAPLDDDDPRRITDSNPIFQPLRKGGKHPELENAMYDAEKGLSKGGIRDIIKKVTARVLKKIVCTVHDLRRTYATLAFESGMTIPNIKKVMRHTKEAITLLYIGTPPSFKNSFLAKFIKLE